MWSIFLYAYLPSEVSVKMFEVSVKMFGLFSNQVVCFLTVESESSLFILDSSPLSDISFANIFSQSVVSF